MFKELLKMILKLKPSKQIKSQVLSLPDKQKSIVRARKLNKLNKFNKLNRTFFSDEKAFKVQDYRNPQNCRVYGPCDQKKNEISDSRLYSRRTDFSNLFWCQ